MSITDIVNALPRELRRSAGVVAGHVREGALLPERTAAKNLGGLLFSKMAFEQYASWLREHPDGRLGRFNVTSPGRARFRGEWYQQRHRSPAEWGRVNFALAAANGKTAGRRPEVDDSDADEVRQRAARGQSQRAIVRYMDGRVTHKQVRRVLAIQKT